MAITDAVWTNPVSGSFNTAADWSTGQVPGANNSADLTASGSSYTVTSSLTNKVAALNIGASATLSVTAGSFTVYSATNAYGNPQTDASNNGTINVGAGAHLVFGAVSSPSTYSSFILNTGTIALNSTGTTAILEFAAPVNTLRGGGTVTLSGKTAIVGGSTAGVLDNIDNTIAGSGTIGSANLTLVNSKNGTINANGTAALILNTSTNTIGNSGLIESTGSGGLTVDSTINDQGSVVGSGTGAITLVKAAIQGGGNVSLTAAKSSIKLENGTISIGGTVSTVASSTIYSTSGTNTLDTGDFENAGTLLIQNGSTLLTSAYINNSGTVELAGTSAATTMEIATGNTSLQGTGKLLLTNSAENAIVSNGTQVQLTNRSTIMGSGTIGDADLRFVNLTGGVVNANGSVALTIVGDSAPGENSDYNNALMEATGTGGLVINGVFGNAGTIEALGTGALALNGVTMTSGGGIVEAAASGSSIILNGSTISGGTFTTVAGSTATLTANTTDSLLETVNNAGTFRVANGATLIGSDSHWNNTGLIELDGTSAATRWEVGTSSTTTEQWVGGGTVDLTGTMSSIVSNGSAAFLRNVNNTIEGAGTIGDSNLNVQNQASGIIDATGLSGLILNTGANEIYNRGTLQSDSSGGIAVDSAFGNDGKIIANTGTIDFAGAVYNAGIATINNSAAIEFQSADYNDVHFGAGASGTLLLDNSSTAADAFAGTIYGFSGNDTIDLRDVAYSATGTSLTYNGSQAGSLSVTDGTHATSLSFVGNYSGSSFVLSSDQHGGTFVKL